MIATAIASTIPFIARSFSCPTELAAAVFGHAFSANEATLSSPLSRVNKNDL
jgi:hypothetical protein